MALQIINDKDKRIMELETQLQETNALLTKRKRDEEEVPYLG